MLYFPIKGLRNFLGNKESVFGLKNQKPRMVNSQIWGFIIWLKVCVSVRTQSPIKLIMLISIMPLQRFNSAFRELGLDFIGSKIKRVSVEK